MTLKGFVTVAIAASTLSLIGCASRSSDVPRPVDLSLRGHLAFGCALERGTSQVDAMTMHYFDAEASFLFEAGSQARPVDVIAKQLLRASESMHSNNRQSEREDILRICSQAGFQGIAGMSDLVTYACGVNARLVAQRPHVWSFGLVQAASSGDSLRTDAMFLDGSYLLFAYHYGPQWLDADSPGAALGAGSDTNYRKAIQHFAALCGHQQRHF